MSASTHYDAAVTALPWDRPVLALDELDHHEQKLHWMESNGTDTWLVSWNEPDGFNGHMVSAGSSAHSYGGGVYTILGDNAVAVRASDGQLWDVNRREQLTSVRGQFGGLRASGPGHVLAVVDSGVSDKLMVWDHTRKHLTLLHTAPFLGSPVVSGDWIAWTQWGTDAPPWTHCEVWVAQHNNLTHLTGVTKVAGGPGESAIEPAWDTTRRLHYMSDRSGWYNLYRWDGTISHPIVPVEADCAAAPWELGYRSYTFLPSGQIATLARSGPPTKLLLHRPSHGTDSLSVPFQSVKPYLTSLGTHLAIIGASATRPLQVALIDPDRPQEPHVLRETTREFAASDGLPHQTQILKVPTPVGSITVVLHTPKGPQCGPAPVIVRAHPGPTHQIEMRYDADLSYYSSRGLVVADVEYRGGTGQGRDFRLSLNNAWGQADVADCVAVAHWLIQRGIAAPGHVCIAGASAGGFTALNAACLTSNNPFSMAIARSAVVDPPAWAHQMPKFHRANAVALGGKPVDGRRAQIPCLLIHATDDPITPVTFVAKTAHQLAAVGRLIDLFEVPTGGHSLTGIDVRQLVLRREYDAIQTLSTNHG